MDLHTASFICLDCEFTGLDREKDHILELAAVRFNFAAETALFERLAKPPCPISPSAFAVHHISEEMVHNQAPLEELLPSFLEFIADQYIIGHAIHYDVEMIERAAARFGLSTASIRRPFIDTLRLARHYGDSPNNSLEQLALHFNVANPTAHRALNDVRINIEVFKHLVRKYKTVEQIFDLLSRPIKMKYMPLGKYKGRLFSDIPLHYLQHSLQMDFDQDLRFTLQQELKRRRSGTGFDQATNPFLQL